jgi:hypothetical protein
MTDSIGLLLQFVDITRVITFFALILISYAIITMGKAIENIPTDYESTRIKSWSSPGNATRYAVYTIWAVYAVQNGVMQFFATAVLPTQTLYLVFGLVSTVIIYLLAITTVIFTMVCYQKIGETERNKVKPTIKSQGN